MALPALPRLADRLTVVSVKSKTALPDTTVAVPRIQLGLYKMSGREARELVKEALAVGYRGFDCAQMYYNEREAGLAIKNFLAGPQNTQGLRREDIFYTSKLAENETSYDAVKRSIAQSVEACGLDYIDLFLLHSPYGGKKARLASWKALEDAVLEGKVRAAGVSNYGVAHIEELMKAVEASDSGVKPVLNQIEVHPFNTQTGIRDTCKKHGIEIEAYAPLVAGMRMGHPKIVSLAKKYECSPAQLLVGWSLEHGMVTLPKTSRPQRLIENADVGSLKISEEDMNELDALDERLVTDWDPTECR